MSVDTTAAVAFKAASAMGKTSLCEWHSSRPQPSGAARFVFEEHTLISVQPAAEHGRYGRGDGGVGGQGSP